MYIGIDLGTTFSAVAVLGGDGQPDVVPNAEGERTTASALLFEDEEVIVGMQAKRAAATDPELVAEDVKRYMGDTSYPRVIRGRQYSPVFLASLILRKLADDAALRLGPIDGAVVTVPAYYDEGRRQATAAACQSAGIRLLDIVNEPTAAALAFAFREFIAHGGQAGDLAGAGKAATRARNTVVYDLGGGTFDVTVMRFGPGSLRVLATAGDTQLGGRDWDQRLFDHFADAFLKAHQLDPRDDPHSRQELMTLAEQVKKELSYRPQARYTVAHAGYRLRGAVTREQFEQMTADLLFRTQSRLTRVVREAGLRWEQLDELLLVGGSTRMPQVQAMLRQVTGREPNRTLSPDEVVAQGAAIHAAMCVAKGELPSIVTSPEHDRPAARPRDAEEPAQRFLTRLGKRVARGLRSLRTTNVASHSLGVVVRGEQGLTVRRMIERNTALPVHTSRRFGIEAAGQRYVNVRVVEGEAADPDACFPVGTCRIESLPQGLPQGSPVEVTFRYDRSGRLHVEAVHVPSGAWAKTTIERATGVDAASVAANQQAMAQLRGA